MYRMTQIIKCSCELYPDRVRLWPPFGLQIICSKWSSRWPLASAQQGICALRHTVRRCSVMSYRTWCEGCLACSSSTSPLGQSTS